MKIDLLAKALGAHLCAPSLKTGLEIRAVYAGDRMSDLLGAVSDDTLLVTHIASDSLLNLIELMDVPAVCVVNGVTPEDKVVAAANAAHAALLVSPWGLYETCGRLYQLLNRGNEGDVSS